MMKRTLAKLILCIFLLCFLSACATGVTKRVDLDAELVGDSHSVSVQDYRTVADKMARSLIRLHFIQQAENPPTIAFVKLDNRTNTFIDTRSFQEKIRTLLIKNCQGKIIFLDRAKIKEIQAEKERKEMGVVTGSAKASQNIYGADYFLTGAISSINRIQGTEKTEYRRYSFRLTDADSSAIVWEDDYETRYYKSKALMDR